MSVRYLSDVQLFLNVNRNIQGGLDVLISGGNGRYTMLQTLCIKSRGRDFAAEGVALLLRAGADPNIPGEPSQRRALHYAVANNLLEVVAMLLDAGADPNLQSTSGSTAFHTAVETNRPELVQMLLKYNADITIPIRPNETPLEYAQRKGYGTIVGLLQAAADTKQEVEQEAKQEVEQEAEQEADEESEESDQEVDRKTKTYADGSTYTGDFRNGKPHGTGTKIWKDGTKYNGRWHDGCPHVDGVLMNPDGTINMLRHPEQATWWDDKPAAQNIHEFVARMHAGAPLRIGRAVRFG
jgi:hypothetical protein